MKLYSYFFILIFSVFLLAPPAISFFEIDNAVANTSFFEEENSNSNKSKIGFDWDVLKKPSCVKPLELSDKKDHFSKHFSNNKLGVYLNPTVPPPRYS